MKCVLGIGYILADVQYEDDFTELDLNDKLDGIVGFSFLKRYEIQV